MASNPRDESRDARTGLGRILKNAASSQGVQAAEVATFLLLTPFIVKRLGVEQYGVWGIIWAAVGMFALVDLGFGRVIVKFIADARGKDDETLHKKTVSTLFWVFALQACVLIPVTAVLTTSFDRIFNAPPAFHDQGRAALLFVASGAIAGLPMALFRGVMVGNQTAWIANLYHLLGLVAYAGAVWIVLPDSPHLTTLAYLNLVRTVATPLFVAAHSLLFIPGTSISLRYFDREVLKACWRYSTALLVIHLTSFLGVRLDIFIIQAVLPMTAVAWYSVAARVSSQVKQFCSQVETVIEPIVAELHGAGETDRLVELWLNGARFSIAFATPLVLGCVVLCQPLIVAWMGADFLGAVFPLQLLLGAVWATLIHGNAHIQLSMRGDQRFLALAMVVGQAFNVIASISLVGTYGLPGVAAATLLMPLVADVLIQLRVCKRLEVRVLTAYRKSLGPSIVPAVLMIGLQLAIVSRVEINTLFEVGMVEVIGALVFWASFLLFGVTRAEKQLLWSRLRKRPRGLA